MRIFILSIAVCISINAAAQTYTIRSQGNNVGNGGAYVAPVVTKTFTVSSAKTQSNPYYFSTSSTNKDLPGNNIKTVTQKSSGSSGLYTPVQGVADKANNFSCLSGNCKNGFGTYQSTPNFNYKYVGEFKDGRHHGKGTIYDWEGYITFDGNFENGNKEGYGRSLIYYQEPVFGDGSITKYNTAVQTVYEGLFKNDERHGEGYLAEYTKDQFIVNIYTGNFTDGQKDGEGVLLLFAKNKITAYYSGGWFKGKYHGIGIDSSGLGLFMGEFKNGVRDGEGTAYWSEYKTETKVPVLWYTGKWKDNKREGHGIEYDLKGKQLYEGEFTSDRRNGPGKLYKPDGTFTEGTWVNGLNKELDPPVVAAPVSKVYNEEFNDNQREWSHNTIHYEARVEKGVYHVEAIGPKAYLSTDNLRIRIRDLYIYENDDWSFEATAKSSYKDGSGRFGIGWEDGQFMISSSAVKYVPDMFDLSYEMTRNGSKGKNGETKVKKGFNTLLLIKKGTVLEAYLNGRQLYSGPVGKIEGSLFLVMPQCQASDGYYADYTEIIIKKLN